MRAIGYIENLPTEDINAIQDIELIFSRTNYQNYMGSF